jgi:hypothetical protein
MLFPQNLALTLSMGRLKLSLNQSVLEIYENVPGPKYPKVSTLKTSGCLLCL